MDKVEDVQELTEQPLDKLTKLLDVAKDYRVGCYKEYIEADDRVKQIQIEISKRLEEK